MKETNYVSFRSDRIYVLKNISSSVLTSHTSDSAMLTSAQTFFSNAKYSKIWDTNSIANDFGNFTPTNNPVRNKLQTVIPTSIQIEYDGETHNKEDLFGWLNSETSAFVESVEEKNIIDVGTYTFDVTLKDNADEIGLVFYNSSSKTGTITVEITKKPIDVNPFGDRLKDDGSLQDGEEITATTALFNHDETSGKKPQFGIEYQIGGIWTKSAPTVAGTYNVRAYIINANNCNYTINNAGVSSFKKSKRYVEVPHLTYDGIDASAVSGTVTTVPYKGDYYVFKLVNAEGNTALSDVKVGSLGNSILYNSATGEFKARAVGEYTVTVSLADKGANTQWADVASNSQETRVITLKIVKAELKVTYDNASITSWENGERENILITVSGVKNSEPVSLVVYYTENGGTPVYITNDKMVPSEDGTAIIVTVDLETFKTNKKYKLCVQKEENFTNNNYTLDNSGSSYEFLILNAIIKNIDVQWHVSNIISGEHQPMGNDSFVNYNGQEYTMALNETKLAKGLTVNYENATATNAGSYTTKVTIGHEDGYEIASSLETEYTINWEIKPLEYDLVGTKWADNFVWTGLNQEMVITNLPTWATCNVDGSSEYRKVNVNTNENPYYTAVYILESDINHTFVYSEIGTDADGAIIEADGRQATIHHQWTISKVTIEVSNLLSEWKWELQKDVNHKDFQIPVPNAVANYETQLNVEYFEDSNFTTPAVISEVEVDPENAKTYFARVSLNNDFANNYVVKNKNNTEQNYAFVRFTIGGGKTIITVTISNESVTYNGENQQATVSYSGLTFTVTYYTDLTGTTELPNTPINAGKYMALIVCDDDTYDVSNNTFEFTINKLELTTNGWASNGGKDAPSVNVIASSVSDETFINSLFETKIFDNDGNEVSGELSYNSVYTAKLTAKNENVIFKDDAQTEYAFRTDIDPNSGEIMQLQKPVLLEPKLTWTGEELTFVISDWINSSRYLEFAIGSLDTLKQTNVGSYSVTIQIKSGENAMWADGTTAPVKLEFEVVARELDKPYVAENQNPTYTGEEIEFIPTGFDDKFMTISGNIETIVGNYTLTIKLKDTANSYWKEASEETASLLNALSVEDIVLEWKILPKQIKGEWKTEDGILKFVPEDSEQTSLFEVKYFDAENNEVQPENFVEGTSYTAKLLIKDENEKDNYEFVSDSENFTTELEFEFIKEKAEESFLDKAINFVKTNWMWFVIGLGVLLFLLFIILIFKRRKKKKEAEEAKKAEEKAKEEKLKKEETSEVNNQNNGNGQNNVTNQPNNAQPNMNNGYNQNNGFAGNMNNGFNQPNMNGFNGGMPMNNGYMNAPQPNMGMMSPQGYGVPPQGYYPQAMYPQDDYYDDYAYEQDEEIEELKRKVKKLTKEVLANAEEKREDKKLSKDEGKLVSFLLENFANTPKWVPFNNEDMVNYSIDDLMKIYTQAKQVAQNRITQRAEMFKAEPIKQKRAKLKTPAEKENTQETLKEPTQTLNKFNEQEKRLQIEAEELERKVAEYKKMKEKLQYEKRLQEVRDRINKVDADNQSLKDYQEQKRKEILRKLKNKKDD